MLITIWPIFAIICLGFVMMRAGFPEAGFWPAAERTNYFVLFPALLVANLADAPVHDPAILRMGGAAAAVILLAALALYLARHLWPMPAARFGPVMQGVVRFNTYLALAVIYSIEGGAGLKRAAVYLAVAVPLVNILAIMALSAPGTERSPLTLVRTMARNPLIVACAIGICLALSGIGLPFGGQDFLDLLAQGSLPLGLLCVGAALQLSSLGQDAGPVTGVSLLRLLLMPMLAAAVAYGGGLEGAEATVLVVFSAVPTAPTAYVLARQLGGDGTFMAGLITAQTLAAGVTIPLVLLVLGYR